MACQWTAARRAVADEFLFKCVGTAKQQATSKLLELMAARRARRMQRKQRKLAKARRRKINGGSSEAYQQFFLTEFETYGKSDDSSDWGSDSSSDWDSDDSSNSTSSPSQKRKFVNAANVPGNNPYDVTLICNCNSSLTPFLC